MATIDRDKLGEYLSAYLDGELSDSERAAVDRLLARDARVRAQLDELRQTVEMVRALPRRAAPPSLLEDLTAVVEREQLLGEPADQMPIRRPWWQSARPVLSMAAVVAIAVGGGLIVYHGMHPPVSEPIVAGRGGDAVGLLESTEAEPASTEKYAEVGATDRGRLIEEAALAGRRAGGAETAGPKGEFALRPAEADRMAGTVAAPAGASPETEFAPPPSSAVVAELDVSDVNLGAPLAAAPGPGFQQLVAGLTLEQKNEAGLGGEALADHLFANESNQLAVVVNDRDDELLARSQLATFAKARRLCVIYPGPETPSLSNVEPVYMEGQPGRNYEAAAPTQVLVRLPTDEVPELLEAVAYNPSGRRPTRLTVGPLVADGLDEAQRFALRMQRPLGEPKMLTDGYVAAADGALGPAVEQPAAGPRADDVGPRSHTTPIDGLAAREAEPPASDKTVASAGSPVVSMEKRGDRRGRGAVLERGPAGRGPSSAAPRGEVAEEAGELEQSFGGVLSRFLRPGVAAEGDKETAPGAEAHDRKDDREKLDVGPGRLVDRNLDALERKETAPDETVTYLSYDGSRKKGEPVGQLVTLVVQFCRPPAAQPSATQPAPLEEPPDPPLAPSVGD